MARLTEPSTHARARGRPRQKRQLVLTEKRRRVLLALVEARQRGERVTLAEIARRTGLHDYRDVRRTVKALEALGYDDLRAMLRLGENHEKG